MVNVMMTILVNNLSWLIPIIIAQEFKMNTTYFPMEILFQICYRKRLEWLSGKERTQFAECCGQLYMCSCLFKMCAKEYWIKQSYWCQGAPFAECHIDEFCNYIFANKTHPIEIICAHHLTNRLGFWSNILFLLSTVFVMFLMILMVWIGRIVFQNNNNKNQNDNMQISPSNESIRESKSRITNKISSINNSATKRRSSEKIKSNRQTRKTSKVKQKRQKSVSSNLTVSKINFYLQ